MSDYISKSALRQEILDKLPIGGSRGVFLAFIDDAPTISETEIIRKAFERVVERLEEKAKENDYTAWQYDDDGTEYIKEKYDEIANAYREAIEIVKEECGISE